MYTLRELIFVRELIFMTKFSKNLFNYCENQKFRANALFECPHLGNFAGRAFYVIPYFFVTSKKGKDLISVI